MSLFENVKENITAREAAEAYGLRVNRYGMTVCPFHDDHNPSMKIDKRYYCFGCGAKGDVIDLVANLFGLSLKDAALKLATDFGISYEEWKPPDASAVPIQTIRKRSIYKRFSETRLRFWKLITDYHHMLCLWRETYTPKDPDAEPDDRYAEAVCNITELEYVMDTFLEGDLETQVDIINDYGRKITDYETRLKGSATGEAGSSGTNDGYAGERYGTPNDTPNCSEGREAS